MKFHLTPHAIKTEGSVESIALDISRGTDLQPVRLSWTRGKNTDWTGGTIEPINMKHLEDVRQTISSLTRFIFNEEDPIDINDPDALITAMEREGSEVYVRNAGGSMVRWSDAAKNSDRDEYIMEAVDGMKKRYACWAEDEDRARTMLTRLLVSKADEDDTVYDELKLWGTAGKPVKKVEKKSTVVAPDFGAYCKRGHQRSATQLKVKKGMKIKKDVAAAQADK